MTETTLSHGPTRSATWLMLTLCVITAALEGLDIQSIGVAAPKLLREFDFDSSQAGYMFSASIAGLVLGALIGGALSDRIGRKWVLAGSVAAFGLFSLSTTLANDLPMLVATRFLTGLGLGGAMPNLIALVSENTPERWRATATTAVWAGTPAGGFLAAQIAAVPGWDWRVIFIVGGVLPLLVAPAIALLLPESRSYQAARQQAAQPTSWRRALLGDGRAATTALLWIGHFGTLLVLYVLLNWLPTLLSNRGFGPSEAALSASAYNIGAVFGALALAVLLGVAPRRPLIVLVYLGMAAGLVGLAYAGADLATTLAFAAVLGVFVIGGQYVLYGVTAEIYPTEVRGTGVGAAVAVGRLGAVIGPIMAGQLLLLGYSVQGLLMGLLPLALAAGAAVVIAIARAAKAP